MCPEGLRLCLPDLFNGSRKVRKKAYGRFPPGDQFYRLRKRIPHPAAEVGDDDGWGPALSPAGKDQNPAAAGSHVMDPLHGIGQLIRQRGQTLDDGDLMVGEAGRGQGPLLRDAQQCRYVGGRAQGLLIFTDCEMLQDNVHVFLCRGTPRSLPFSPARTDTAGYRMDSAMRFSEAPTSFRVAVYLPP